MITENKFFRKAIIFSVGVHGVILLTAPDFGLLSIQKKAKEVEITYVRAKQELKKTLRNAPRPVVQGDITLPDVPTKLTGQHLPPPQYAQSPEVAQAKQNILRPVKEMPRGGGFAKPAFSKPDFVVVKKKVTLPSINLNNLDKINNPTYVSYYQVVREKIRRAAYQNYGKTEEGEVYLSFIISSDGGIRDIRLVDEKSSGNSYLRETALRSIRDAAPFPAFPKDLDYPELSFNIVISFEIE